MDQARLFAYWLNKRGYDITLFVSGELLIEALLDSHQHFDLILMDWMLPGHDGLETMRSITGHNGIPVVFLTGKNQDKDLAEALNSGADDFVSKPVSETVLLARVQAVLRRYGKALQPASLLILKSDSLLCFGEQKQSLSSTELKLMQLFIQNEGVLLQREELADEVWGDADKANDGRALDLLISRIRKKLQAFTPVPAKISSRYGQGYVFEKMAEGSTE
jgi:DNA-binding response OmpR family regulator